MNLFKMFNYLMANKPPEGRHRRHGVAAWRDDTPRPIMHLPHFNCAVGLVSNTCIPRRAQVTKYSYINCFRISKVLKINYGYNVEWQRRAMLLVRA